MPEALYSSVGRRRSVSHRSTFSLPANSSCLITFSRVVSVKVSSASQANLPVLVVQVCCRGVGSGVFNLHCAAAACEVCDRGRLYPGSFLSNPPPLLLLLLPLPLHWRGKYRS